MRFLIIIADINWEGVGRDLWEAGTGKAYINLWFLEQGYAVTVLGLHWMRGQDRELAHRPGSLIN